MRFSDGLLSEGCLVSRLAEYALVKCMSIDRLRALTVINSSRHPTPRPDHACVV
jgi:hypothetical protein